LRRLRVYHVTAALAAVLSVPCASAAGQLSGAAEIQGALFPREPSGRAAADAEIRGWSSVAYDRSLFKNLDFNADLIVYGSNLRRAVIDGDATVTWRGADVAVSAGLLRERWERFTDSPLDPLGPANTPFSLVHPELRLSQPTIKATLFFEGVSVDAYALAGWRRQPLPESDQRFGFGVETRDVADRGSLGDQAIAVRVSGTELALDWSVHVYGGLNRRPTFVPRFTPDARLGSVDAVYTDVLQFGGELETTRADWRFFAEGFGRRGAIDVTGQDRTYGYVAAAAEYQRLGAFGGHYNFIPRFEFMADTRGDRADIPFASAARAGLRLAQTGRLPLQLETGYSFDWVFRGHGVMASLEKALAESPTLNVGFRFTAFRAGSKPGVLDIWEDDLELYSYVRIELSR
jgi:hypothetical protein